MKSDVDRVAPCNTLLNVISINGCLLAAAIELTAGGTVSLPEPMLYAAEEPA